MKIKTRKQRIKEYNAKYPIRDADIESALRNYFIERRWDLTKASKKAADKLQKIIANREYETVQITMYEYPMKTERPRNSRGLHMYSPNAKENHTYFEKAYRKVIEQIRLINTPAEIVVDAYLEMPEQVKPDEVILFESKVLDVLCTPDYDNIGKCYTDILKDVLITDDDIFHIGTIRKYYSVIPRVVITITYLKAHESDYIYKKLKTRKAIKEGIASGHIVLNRLE